MTRMAGRLGLAALLTTILLAGAASPARAHGDEAFVLVREAIALIANRPDNRAAIADKINDALESDDPANVQIPLVRQAKAAFDAGDLHQTRSLLERSIGARVHTAPAEPAPINSPPPTASRTPAGQGSAAATTEPTAMPAMATDLPGRRGLTSGDWVLLLVSLAVASCGIALAARMRPHLARHSRDKTATAR